MIKFNKLVLICCIYAHKKRRPLLFIHQPRPSHCLIEQITQQETYADMTTHYPFAGVVWI